MRIIPYRIIALSVAVAVLFTSFITITPLISVAEEVTYNNSFTVNIPYSLTDLNGDASTVKMDVAANLDSAVSGTDHKRIWWGTFVGNPTGWSEGGILADTTIPLIGYNIQTADGTNGSSGIVTYYSRFAIKNIRFDTSYSDDADYWISKPFSFYASSDGVNFTKISTTCEKVGQDFTRDVCNGMNSQIYDTATFEEADQIHYVRIVSELKGTNPFSKQINRIYGIDYDTYRKTVTYKHKINPRSYYSISGEVEENVQLKREDAIVNTSIPAGWCLMNDEGTTVVDGEVVYDSLVPFKDVRFDTSYQIDSDDYGYWWAKPLEFYASSDGATYNKVETERITGDSALSNNFPNAYAHIYDEVSFTEAEDIHFLKIKIDTDSTTNPYLPRIFAVDYTSYADSDNVTSVTRYQKEVNITPDSEDITIDCAEGVVLDSPKRFNGGWGPYHMYTFHKGAINSESKPENNAEGSVIIKSFNDKPITDWEFGGICGPNPAWSGDFSFYGSDDGKEWRRIENVSTRGNAYIESWEAYEYKYSGSLSAEYGLKYIKITASTGNFSFLPAHRYLLYSTEGYDSVNFQPAESYVNRMLLNNYYQKGEDYYLFRTGSGAVDFDLHVTEPISDTAAIEVTASSAAEDSDVDYLKTAKRVLVTDNVNGTGEYRYYNSFYSSSQITYINVKLNGATFLYLDYNLASGLEDTLRRHYDDVPISEPIEDLKLPSSNSKFYAGEQNGIGLIENATLHYNGNEKTANYIGGTYGFLSSAGQRDYSIIMETPYVNDFTFRYAFSSEDSAKIRQLKAYGLSEWDGEGTEIPLVRYLDVNYASAGYKNYIFRPADRSKLPACEFHWVRIEVLCETYEDYSELLEFTYFYDIPKIEGMPALNKVTSGLNEVLDSFENPMLSKENGGKADDAVNLKWVNYRVGYNGYDNVIMQDVYGAESYIIYQCDGIKGFDIRGYKQKKSEQDLQILASSDGVEWKEVKVNYLEKILLSNWRGYSYSANEAAIPDNTNYLQIFFNDGIDGDEILVSDVQIFYTGERKTEPEDMEEETTVDEDIDTDDDIETENEKTETKLGRKKLVTRRTVRPIALVIGGVILLCVIGGIATLVIVLIKKKKATKLRR